MKYTPFLVSVLATLAASQTVLQYGTGQLPTCAQNCQALTTANQACIPPAAPVNSQSIYDNCFCQSNFLATNLAVGSSSSVSNVCNTACTSASDQKAIQNWYDALCKSTTTTTGAASATSTSAATSTAATSTGTATSSTVQSSGQRWWHQHARWIAMAIVLIFAFILIGVLGMWLKRRNTRKHQRQAAMAPPVVWGPHQNQHHSRGVGYDPNYTGPRDANGAAYDPNSREKGKQRAGNGSMLPTASSQPVDYSEKDGVKKLKKLFKR